MTRQSDEHVAAAERLRANAAAQRLTDARRTPDKELHAARESELHGLAAQNVNRDLKARAAGEIHRRRAINPVL